MVTVRIRCSKKASEAGKTPTSLYTLNRDNTQGDFVRRVGLCDPVTDQANMLKALFDVIPGVVASYDKKGKTLAVFAESPEKAEAINYFVRRKHKLGKLILKVTVWDVSNAEPEECCPNSSTVTSDTELKYIKTIFDESGIEPIVTQLIDPSGTRWTFLEFPGYTLKYYNDNLCNPRGYKGVMIETIVQEAFDLDKYKVSTIVR